VAEHCHMCDDPERYPHDRGSADDVRSAFDRLSPEHGSDALPLTNPGARRAQRAYPMPAMIVFVTAAALAAGPSADAFAFSSGVSHVVTHRATRDQRPVRPEPLRRPHPAHYSHDLA